jgi:hypothetical protein
MSCSNNITPCGCGNNPCGCGTSSDDVVYQGPNLSCTGVSNCDTVTEAIETIDGFICGPEMVENIINNIINNQNLYNQFTSIVNNTVDCQTVWDCIDAQTTTTTTTVCPCTTYSLIGPRTNPGNITYVPCGESEITTTTASDIVQLICIDNTYSIIEIGNISLNNTFECCTPTTTTTTTINCTCYQTNIQVLSSVINSADGHTVSLNYTNCLGDPISIPYTTAGVYPQTCIDLNLDVILYGTVGGTPTNFYFPSTIGETCCTPITTTTTTILI